jgi:hypothetical protein
MCNFKKFQGIYSGVQNPINNGSRADGGGRGKNTSTWPAANPRYATLPVPPRVQISGDATVCKVMSHSNDSVLRLKYCTLRFI